MIIKNPNQNKEKSYFHTAKAITKIKSGMYASLCLNKKRISPFYSFGLRKLYEKYTAERRYKKS